MARSNLRCVILAAVPVILAVAAWAVWPAYAQKTKPKGPGKTVAQDKKKPEKKETKDPYAVPDGKAEEIIAFVSKLLSTPPKDRADIPKVLEAIVKAGDKILAMKNTDEKHRLEAVRLSLVGYQLMGRFETKDSDKRMKAFIDRMAKDSNKDIRELIAGELLSARTADIPKLDSKQRDKLIDDVVAYVKAGEPKSRLGVAMRVAQSLEEYERDKSAARLYQEIVDVLKTAKDKQLQSLIPRIEGNVRRLSLLGNSIDVKGSTVDGEPFDWKKYKGKVVLIDFWATWCGPCRAELPNLKRNYALYHSKGFEVVGISLDDSKDALQRFVKTEKIPWTNLFGTEEKTRGWNHPMATYYGVTGIPMVVLVDQKGKVVSTSARGPQLGRLLKGLLGPADETPKKTEEKKGE